MKQVIQNIRSGKLSVLAVPDPIAKPGHVLIANARSLISAGTEKMAIELARKSLLGKARERPDHVRRVIEKLKQEGFFNTLAQVSEKLDEPMPMGYSSAGVVLACGAGVQGFKPGDRVASNGPHAGIVCVPHHLCAHVPENVSFDHAAFAVLGAIALQGVRLARMQLGETAMVIGLGLVGQLTVALLKAQGNRVIATDPVTARCELAVKMGADLAAPGLKAQDVFSHTRELGADTVLIAASTRSDEPIQLAADCVRQKGRVIAIGAVGMNLPRRPLYFKEAEFAVSCSYGPGRYDPEYEERGHDYPAGHVRWTEQRNLQAVLDLMGAGTLDVSLLISHRYAIEEAEKAYRLIQSETDSLGVLLEYPDVSARQPMRAIELRTVPVTDDLCIGWIGLGNFARSTLLPALKKTGCARLRAACSVGGLSVASAGDKHGFEVVATDEAAVLSDEQVKAVIITTRHEQHAPQVIAALRAGKAVFVEKPLCLTPEELADIESLIPNLQAPFLQVGFNRRFSPAAQLVKDFFADGGQPLAVSIRFNAGAIPPGHWTQDDETGGGRIIGEACHAMDLATFITGAPPVRVFAESVGGANTGAVTDDQCFITLRHANGSISSIAYLAGGDKAYPKERIEVIGGGRVAVIDDFRSVTTVKGGHARTRKFAAQDKGHSAEIEAFVKALKEGSETPIPWPEIRATTLASILAVRSLREGIPFEVA